LQGVPDQPTEDFYDLIRLGRFLNRILNVLVAFFTLRDNLCSTVSPNRVLNGSITPPYCSIELLRVC
jgi:hypothetical protein